MSGLTHTLQPNRVPYFFTDENVDYIRSVFSKTLAMEYRQKVDIPRKHVRREMDLVHNEQPSTVEQMNQRVILNLLRAFRNESDEIARQNHFSDSYRSAYNYDPSLGIKPFEKPKLNTRYTGFRFNSIGGF